MKYLSACCSLLEVKKGKRREKKTHTFQCLSIADLKREKRKKEKFLDTTIDITKPKERGGKKKKKKKSSLLVSHRGKGRERSPSLLSSHSLFDGKKEKKEEHLSIASGNEGKKKMPSTTLPPSCPKIL